MNDKVLLFIIEMALIKLEEEYDKAKIDILQFNGIIFQRWRREREKKILNLFKSNKL